MKAARPLRKILVIQTAFIGDVVLVLGAVQSLKDAHPEAEIHFLLRKGNENLLEGHPAISRVWIWDKKRKWASLRELYPQLARERFDLLVNFQRFFTMGLFSALLPARAKAGFRKSPFALFYTHAAPHEHSQKGDKTYLHEVDRNHAVIFPWVGGEAQRPKLYPSAVDYAHVSAWSAAKPYVVLAPASVWFTKQWPEQRWAELLERLQPNTTAYLVGGPSDTPLCERLSATATQAVNLAGKLTFLQTAALMSEAQRVFANDSAPLHFASAMNAPTTAIYCSTIPEFGFGPLADDARILETPEALACRPCGLHGHDACPQDHFRCAWGISAEMAVDTVY
jgi:ADP-heptose:LPS heptosyltransferase